MTNTKTIARNAGWYGLENAISFVVTLFTSIAIARTLGPSKMGYIIYVTWIASIVSTLGGMGIPETTRKYMAEFIGKGDHGTARYIYVRTLRLQMILASLATGGILFWVLRDSTTEYRVASVLVVLSIWPAMVNFVSAQANVATEKLSTNLPASVISTLVFFLAIAATVILHWGVLGVGIAMFSMRTVDFLVRLIPTMKRIFAWGKAHLQPPGLAKRMMAFAWQSVTSMILALIVWNRSEVILLKYLSADIRQIAYYSVAFSMAERLLISSVVFGSATGATIFAQYGRDKSRLPAIAASIFRYLAMTAIPLHFIAAALAFPALLLLYGNQYRGAATVVTLAPLLCMPKAFMAPMQSLLQSMERQGFVILSTVFAGIVDLGVASYLIPAHGAVGACIGSGAAQIMAVGTMWAIGIHLYKVKLPWLLVAKIVIISMLASLTAHYVALRMVPVWGLLCGGVASLIVLFGLLYLMRVLEPEDRARFGTVIRMLPKAIAGPLDGFILLLIRPKADGLAPVGM
ncbi:MAG: oligosaccharide flippase family protein [Terracidiphilus sp.]|jgi:O-antigen/teichoic acid export membrane protein